MKDIGYIRDPEQMAWDIRMMLKGLENAPGTLEERVEHSEIWFAVECTHRGIRYLIELETEFKKIGYNARFDTCEDVWAFGVYDEEMNELFYVDSEGSNVNWSLFEE